MNTPNLHITADDLTIDIKRNNNTLWTWFIRDTSELPAVDKAIMIAMTAEQTSACLALFIGEHEGNSILNTALYEIAEEAVKGLPLNLRPIP